MPMKRYIIHILFITFFMGTILSTVGAQESLKNTATAMLKGAVLDINLEERYFDIKGGGDHSSAIRIYVDDPARLRGLRKGLPVRVWAQESKVIEGAYVAREIMIPGITCRCDPTGVRARMKRAMRRGGWSCGGWSGQGAHK